MGMRQWPSSAPRLQLPPLEASASAAAAAAAMAEGESHCGGETWLSRPSPTLSWTPKFCLPFGPSPTWRV